MPYYFRNVGETSVTIFANQGFMADSDLTLISVMDYQSPIRFQRSTDMIICPYLTYLSDDYSQCVSPSVITLNPISFIQMSGIK